MDDKKKKVTIPCSDTIPGPVSCQVEITGGKEKELPAVEPEVPVDEIGQGTAQDVPSSATR